MRGLSRGRPLSAPVLHPLHLDHAAGQPVAGVAGRLGGAVVGAGVEDHRLAGDPVGAGERELAGGEVEMAGAVRADLDVAEVAGVPRVGGRAGVRRVGGVEVPARGAEVLARRIVMGALAVLVEVEAVLPRRDALEVGHQVDAVGGGGEGDGAGEALRPRGPPAAWPRRSTGWRTSSAGRSGRGLHRLRLHRAAAAVFIVSAWRRALGGHRIGGGLGVRDLGAAGGQDGETSEGDRAAYALLNRFMLPPSAKEIGYCNVLQLQMHVGEVAGEQDLDRRRRLVARQPEVELPLPAVAVGHVDAADREVPDLDLLPSAIRRRLDARAGSPSPDRSCRPTRSPSAASCPAGSGGWSRCRRRCRAPRSARSASSWTWSRRARSRSSRPGSAAGCGCRSPSRSGSTPPAWRVGGDGELALQVAVAHRLEGERALAVVGQEEAGDGAEEVAELPAVLELLVLDASPARRHGPGTRRSRAPSDGDGAEIHVIGMSPVTRSRRHALAL